MKILYGLALIFLLSACMQPAYKKYNGADTTTEEINALDVTYQLLPAFDQSLPDCVFVLETQEEFESGMGLSVARALARHMGEKVDRVIFPRVRERISRKQGLDLSHEKDRQHFAARQRCGYAVIAELYDLGDDYAVIFARKYLGLKIELRRIRDHQLLWQAAHTVWRADGGVPLSPLGAIGGIAQAAALNQDREALESMIDDALRRILRTLPAV